MNQNQCMMVWSYCTTTAVGPSAVMMLSANFFSPVHHFLAPEYHYLMFFLVCYHFPAPACCLWDFASWIYRYCCCSPFLMSSFGSLAWFGKCCALFSFGKLSFEERAVRQRNWGFALSSLTEKLCIMRSFCMPPFTPELFVLRCLCQSVESSSWAVHGVHVRCMLNMCTVYGSLCLYCCFFKLVPAAHASYLFSVASQQSLKYWGLFLRFHKKPRCCFIMPSGVFSCQCFMCPVCLLSVIVTV